MRAGKISQYLQLKLRSMLAQLHTASRLAFCVIRASLSATIPLFLLSLFDYHHGCQAKWWHSWDDPLQNKDYTRMSCCEVLGSQKYHTPTVVEVK